MAKAAAKPKAKAAYTRKRVALAVEHVERGEDLIEQGKVPGRGIEFADTRTAGLILRVTPRASTFMLKTEAATIRLGEANRLTVEQARDQAALARISLKRGRDPRRQVAAFEASMGQTADVAASAEVAAAVDDTPAQTEADRRAYGPWLWRDLIDEFLAAKLPKLKGTYRSQYESYLRHKAFDRIRDRLVSEIRIKDLEGVRNSVVTSNTASAAHRVVQQGKEALSWAWRYNAGVSGLDVYEFEWWLRWSIEYSSGTRDHVPLIEELARTLALAERHRSLGQTEHATGPGTLAMLWLTVLTGQRTSQTSILRHDRLYPLDGMPGWLSANWSGSEMKGGKSGSRPHALPLPPQALAVLKRILAELDEPSPWACPSSRGDGHANQSAVNKLLWRLEGLDNNGDPKPGRANLLALHGIEPWTPHDARRTLGSFLGDRRLGGAASAILSHKEGKGESEKERTAAVTRLHYDRGQRMALKAEGMELWVAAVVEAYERERAALALLPMPAPPPRTKRRPRVKPPGIKADA
ncbi:integrase [Methylorubrum rhodinum]|uniref:Integrase n=1 Tax=Methylorubrum rhodinum TaxID=29428 RepID=A0A840ZNK5_9HYPH|nr:integrase arm-type DNA-binding domain-containing protein [Methylorubrum rhodinum]MBB5758343.1 integrase [Methylorubrum rhodinum]